MYARVSTKTQADKKLSIPVQLGLMRAHVKSSGWQEVAAFEEPGKSGTLVKRLPVLNGPDRGSHWPSAPLRHGASLRHFPLGGRNTDAVLAKEVIRQRGIRVIYLAEQTGETEESEDIEGAVRMACQDAQPVFWRARFPKVNVKQSRRAAGAAECRKCSGTSHKKEKVWSPIHRRHP